MRTPRHTSILGIAFGGGGVSAVLVRRNGERPTATHVLSTPLSLDLLAGDPELIGLELAQRLGQAGIRERRCVVCVPLAWVLSLRVDLPDLPAADQHDFLLTQAEREFLIAPAEMALAVSHFQTPEGGKGATLVAVQAAHLLRLRRALKAARLQVVAFTLGVAALATSDAAEAEMTLLVGGADADLAVAGLGGLLAVRHLAANTDPGTENDGDPLALARQIRITCGQLPAALRAHVRHLRVLGAAQATAAFLREAPPVLAALRLTSRQENPAWRGTVLHQEAGPAGRVRELAAQATALAVLDHGTVPLRFDLPRKDTLRALWRQRGVRLLLWLAGATAAAALLAVSAILYQAIHLSRQTAERARIGPQVRRIQHVRDRVRELRPWLSDDADSLGLLQVLSLAFPEDGVVWATDLKIKGLSEVTVSGKATDRQAWFAMQERLRKTPGISELRISQTRENAEGSDPMTFALTFNWQPGGSNVGKE